MLVPTRTLTPLLPGERSFCDVVSFRDVGPYLGEDDFWDLAVSGGDRVVSTFRSEERFCGISPFQGEGLFWDVKHFRNTI